MVTSTACGAVGWLTGAIFHQPGRDSRKSAGAGRAIAARGNNDYLRRTW